MFMGYLGRWGFSKNCRPRMADDYYRALLSDDDGVDMPELPADYLCALEDE